jgi:hypothetical protein
MERLVLENIQSALFEGRLLTQVHEQLVKTSKALFTCAVSGGI